MPVETFTPQARAAPLQAAGGWVVFHPTRGEVLRSRGLLLRLAVGAVSQIPADQLLHRRSGLFLLAVPPVLAAKQCATASAKP